VGPVELLIARNPDPGSSLTYLLRVPLGEGMVLRTAGTWPRTKALYCYPAPVSEWPADADIVERVPLLSCARRGAAIDVVADRARENRSQLVFTTARGRDAVFWQSPRTRKQARPNVTTPTARAAGIAELEIFVDSHERYAYRFAAKPVRTVSRVLPCGDYGVIVDGQLVAAVERKSLPDLVSSLTSGRLRYALGELAALPRAAVVVEDRYSQIFKQDRARPALVADGLAECQVRWPNIPIIFGETRPLAEEWTYRYLTLGTRLVNKGVPQHVIQRLLGHASPLMTGLYAQLHDATLRQEFERYCQSRVDVEGRLIGFDPDAATADAEWVKHNLARAPTPFPTATAAAHPSRNAPTQRLSHLRPVPDDRRVPARPPPTKSGSPPSWPTPPTPPGVTRLADNHRRVAANLDKIITALENLSQAGR
jgi:hypothetical protein